MNKSFKLLTLAFLAVPLTGCYFDVDPASVVDNFYDKRRIYIEEDNVVVNVGEDRFVTVDADNLGKDGSIDNLTFTSCDPSVATASYGVYETEEEEFEGMYIHGLSQGDTSVIASFKNASASCQVRVINDAETPYLHLFNENITIEKGTEYIVNSEVLYKGEKYSPCDGFDYDFSYIEGAPEIVELYQDDDSGEIVVNPIEVGFTEVLVSTTLMEKEMTALLSITVTEPGVGIVINNEGFDHVIGNTYWTKLYVADYQDYSKSIDLDIELFKNDAVTEDKITLVSDNPEIAKIEGYHLEGVSKGTTTIHGTFDDIELTIHVLVDKPLVKASLANKNIEIDEKAELQLVDTSMLSGDITGLYYQTLDSKVNVFSSFDQGRLIIDEDKMRTLVDDFGENKKFYVETSDIYVDLGVCNVYSKILRNYDDLCSFGTIAQKYVTGRYDFNGYFILSNNIECDDNATPVAFNRNSNFRISGIGECINTRVGFNGVFDGKGYTINNYKPSGFGSFITWLTKDGILQNIGFDNVHYDISLLGQTMGDPNGVLVCNGQGKVSNVYVGYSDITTGLAQYANKYCSTFCNAGSSVQATSVFVNASSASINGDFDVLGKLQSANGVYSVGGTHINSASDFGTDPVIDSRIFYCTGIYRAFATASEMKEHLQTQSTIANWNRNCWSGLEEGIPTWKNAK